MGIRIFVITTCAILVNNPYLMSVIFGQILLLVTSLVRNYSKFIGFILFLVYIGGIMILIRYCVILMPHNKFIITPKISESKCSEGVACLRPKRARARMRLRTD